MVAGAYNFSTWEAKEGESLSQTCLCDRVTQRAEGSEGRRGEAGNKKE